MPQDPNQPPRSLTSKAPSWTIRSVFKRFNVFASRIEPEVYTQSQGGVGMTRYGIVKAVGGQFAEFSNNQFSIERPSPGVTINPEKALANNRGFV
jgi:hypothetical protein